MADGKHATTQIQVFGGDPFMVPKENSIYLWGKSKPPLEINHPDLKHNMVQSTNPNAIFKTTALKKA